MGLHHQTTHGRVFRGLDAKSHLANHKRDSHGDRIKMNIPKHMLAAARPADPAQINHHKAVARPADPGQLKHIAAQKDAVKTVDSIVYVTMSADFTGSTAGYVTLSETSAASATVDALSAASSGEQSSAAAQSTTTPASSTVVVPSTATVSPASSTAAINNKSMFLNPPATAAAMTSSATFGAAAVGGTPIAATRGGAVVGGTPISATRTPQPSHGMDSGAKAGLAFGIIFAIALLAGLLFFCSRRRKNAAAKEETFDEKRPASFFGGSAAPVWNNRASEASMRTAHTAATAPRLSLRPVTQFLPNLGGNRKSLSSTAEVATSAMSEKPRSMWERRAQSAVNPFDDDAVSEKQARPESTTVNPFDEPEGQNNNGQASPTSVRSGSEPPTPSSLKFGTASAVPVAASGTAAAVPPMPSANNVHRVQLDFKPSMEDELELKSGQLVRMLHEYDDGWVSHVDERKSSTIILTVSRRFVSAWTAPNKVSARVPAFPTSQSSHAKVLHPPSHPPTTSHGPPPAPCLRVSRCPARRCKRCLKMVFSFELMTLCAGSMIKLTYGGEGLRATNLFSSFQHTRIWL